MVLRAGDAGEFRRRDLPIGPAQAGEHGIGPRIAVATADERDEAVRAAAEDGHRLFLEVSAHPVVSHSIVETLLGMGLDAQHAPPAPAYAQPRRFNSR